MGGGVIHRLSTAARENVRRTSIIQPRQSEYDASYTRAEPSPQQWRSLHGEWRVKKFPGDHQGGEGSRRGLAEEQPSKTAPGSVQLAFGERRRRPTFRRGIYSRRRQGRDVSDS